MVKDFNNEDFRNRPSWEMVNPEILGNMFMAEKKFSIWFSKIKTLKANPRELSEYYDWNTHLVCLYLNLKAHLYESDKEEFKQVHDTMESYTSNKIDLTDDQKREVLFKLIRFVKVLGLTNVEVPEAQKHSLVHRS